jgi:hypothetical protein
MSTVTFIHDSLQKGGPTAALGGIVVVAVGFILDRPGMILAGALVTLLVSADYVVMFFLGNRNSN